MLLAYIAIADRRFMTLATLTITLYRRKLPYQYWFQIVRNNEEKYGDERQ